VEDLFGGTYRKTDLMRYVMHRGKVGIGGEPLCPVGLYCGNECSSVLSHWTLSSFIPPRIIQTYVILSVMAIASCRVDLFGVWLMHYKHFICIYIFTDRKS
jgi:hypothetical protein